MYVSLNLTKTGQLLRTVYDQLDSYRDQLTSSSTSPHLHHHHHSSPSPSHNLSASLPTSSAFTSSSTPTSPSYLLLYSAVQSLAQQLSTTAQQYHSSPASSLTHGLNLLNRTATYYAASSASLIGSTSTVSSSTVDDYMSSSSSTASSVWMNGLIESLPMPTDEASINSELGLGPVRDPLWTAIPMTILYLLILVTGLIGNVVTCVVIARNRYMHTATNYYLFSLAISDLLLLMLGLPQEIQQIWQRYPYAFGEVFCILRGFSSEASTNSSVLTITAFTVERYVAICHPLRAHTMSKLSRAVKLIIIIWLLGFLCAAPIAYQFGIVYDYVHDEVLIPQSAACNIKRSIYLLEEHIFALQSLLVFVLPVTVISVLYVLIGLKLRQSSQSAKGDLSRIRRRPVKRLHSESGGSVGSTATTNNYFSSSIESIEINNNSGNTNKSNNGHNGNSKNNANSHHPSPNLSSVAHAHPLPHPHHHKLKEMSSFASINSGHSITFGPTTNSNGTSVNPTHNSYIDHRNRSRLTKFTSSTSSASSASGGSSLAQRRAVIKMLTAVVVAFFVCFAPFHAQRLMAIYVKNPSHYETFAFNLLTYISGVTYYLSATINPILYSIMSVRFRQAFHDTFVRTFCPSKSAIFQCTKQRKMSQMYNSMYYRNSHPNVHHHNATLSASVASPVHNPVQHHHLGNQSLTSTAVIAHPINIAVTHSIIKASTGSTSHNSHPNYHNLSMSNNGAKNIAFDYHLATSMIEEEDERSTTPTTELSKNIKESDLDSIDNSNSSTNSSSHSPSSHHHVEFYCPTQLAQSQCHLPKLVNIITNPRGTKGASQLTSTSAQSPPACPPLDTQIPMVGFNC